MLSAIAIEVFGAPFATVILAPFALMVIVTLIRWHFEDGRGE